MTNTATTALCCLAIALIAPPAEARVGEVILSATQQTAVGGQSFGAVGQYERISGHMVGEVDPKDRLNEIIVDIGLAPVNAAGRVTYLTNFQLLRPIDRTKGNQRLLYALTNSGRTNALGTLNDSRNGNDVTTA